MPNISQEVQHKVPRTGKQADQFVCSMLEGNRP